MAELLDVRLVGCEELKDS